MEDGEVVSLKGWRFEGQDKVQGTNAFKCRTHNEIAPIARFPLTPAYGKAEVPPQTPWPVGLTLTIRGSKPAFTLQLAQGRATIQAGDLLLGEPKTVINEQVRVERIPARSVLRLPPPLATKDAVQDDYPAILIGGRTKHHFVAWVSYHNKKDRVLLAERAGPNGDWSEPIEVARPGDHFRVALAGTHNDSLWVVWSSQIEGNWALFGRVYKDGKLGVAKRLTDAPGNSIWHRMTPDRRGRAWLVWQRLRNGLSEIFARCADANVWSEPVQISAGQANSWDPVIAADSLQDRVWVGWDSYESGNYRVYVRSLTGGAKPVLGDKEELANSDRFNAHVSLANDGDGRLWAAWDEAGTQWGKDSGFLYRNSPADRLYQSRRIVVRCLAGGHWVDTIPKWESVLPEEMREYNELPQLQGDNQGRIWMSFRHRTCRKPRVDGWAIQARWDIFATAYLGNGWLAPIQLEDSGGRNDMRTASQSDDEGNVYFAYASDNRMWQAGMGPRNHSIAISQLSGAAFPQQPKFAPPDRSVPLVSGVLIHPREKDQVARIRKYKIESLGKTYFIYRGDFHRHTDISVDGVGDGSLMDLHRYAIDAAALDFVTVTDHNMGQDDEYCWWRTQKANDYYSIPRTFISMYGYERSVPYPNGHRNVIWTERGHQALPLPLRTNHRQMAADTGRFYTYLKATNGICTLHTSATDQGTNWEEHDGSLEPIVELFQGYHTSYEAPEAPLTADKETDLVHGPYKPDGFVSQALSKGYRLGFQASSDHISTHVSYACVLAEEFSRKGLVAALRKRHCYAATDNIILDVRMGQLGIMGDEVKTLSPQLDVAVVGTGALDRIEIIRDGKLVHAERPAANADSSRFHWQDPDPDIEANTRYYYVRCVQKDRQMAWSSPIWVSRPG